jgi:hypothetical protein
LRDAVQLVAFVDDQVIFAVAPDARNAGDAVIVTVGAMAANRLPGDARIIAAKSQENGREKGRPIRSSTRTCVILRLTMTTNGGRHPAV